MKGVKRTDSEKMEVVRQVDFLIDSGKKMRTACEEVGVAPSNYYSYSKQVAKFMKPKKPKKAKGSDLKEIHMYPSPAASGFVVYGDAEFIVSVMSKMSH